MLASSETTPVRNVSAEEFGAAVLERSHTIAVIVDFWAPWCGPCRTLAPVLEREVAALSGRIELVKVNTDENPELAQSFQIQGIPAVLAFRNGRVVDEMSGAQPAPIVRRWLAALAPSEEAQELERAESLLRQGRPGEAEPILRRLLDVPEIGNAARASLATALLDKGQAEEVPALLEAIDPRSSAADRVPGLERRLQFSADAAAYGGEQAALAAMKRDERDLEARWAFASALAARGDLAGALEEFLELVSRSRKFRDDGARLAMLAIFDQLGDHDLAREYRRRLQIIT